MNSKESAGQKIIFTIALSTLLAIGLAYAVVPSAPPTFSNPLEITATFAPFQEGGVKVFQGSDRDKSVVVVHQYLTESRPFVFDGADVPSRILREMKFEAGQLARLSDNYLAQGDDGSVYCFGKSVSHFTNGTMLGHEGSWLVGGPVEGDPEETLTETEPTVLMPANPEEGDIFKPEDFPLDLSVTARVLRTNYVVGSGLGRFTNAVRILYRPEGKRNYTFSYARDVGLVLNQGKYENWRLISSTLTGTNLVIPTNNFTIPTNTIPTNSIPTNSIPTNSIPTNSIPTNSIPTNSIPTNSIPTNTIPTNTIPTNTIPLPPPPG